MQEYRQKLRIGGTKTLFLGLGSLHQWGRTKIDVTHIKHLDVIDVVLLLKKLMVNKLNLAHLCASSGGII